MKSKVALGKGSPNRLYLMLGAIASNGGSMRQKELAKALSFPVSSVVDLVKKANLVFGMEISVDSGEYKIERWSPIYDKESLVAFFNENKS